jgi:uncharacterized membrane protein YbhN (UPF0104 family)
VTDRRTTWRLVRSLGPLLILAAGAWLVAPELRAIELGDVRLALARIPRTAIALALGLTAASYVTLSIYDLLGLRHLGHRLAYRRVLPSAFVSYAYNFNLGAVIGGMASRYRIYGSWGLGPADVTALNAFCVLTTWVGFSAILGALLLCHPDGVESSLLPVTSLRALGGACALFPLGYLGLCATARGRRVGVGRWRYALPRPRTAALQVLVSTVEWSLPAAVIWTLQAELALPYSTLLGAHLLSAIAGLIVRVPGSLGVLEAVFLRSLAGRAAAPAILATLLAFRTVYYLLPLVLGTIVFAGLEARQRTVGNAPAS